MADSTDEPLVENLQASRLGQAGGAGAFACQPVVPREVGRRKRLPHKG